MSEIVRGNCQWCEGEQEVEGVVLSTGREANTFRFIVESKDRRIHKILKGVTQRVLTPAQIDARLKQKKLKAAQEAEYRGTPITAAAQHPEAQESTSPNEYEAPADETFEGFQ